MWICLFYQLKIFFMRNIIAFFFSFTFVFAQSQTFDLNVEINNIKQKTGNIEVVIYNSPNDFLIKGKALKKYSIKVNNTTSNIAIKGLPKGNYAIAVYHDINSDKKFNTNFVGIPVESYGFSNNCKPLLSKPSFEDCMIDIENSTSICIALL